MGIRGRISVWRGLWASISSRRDLPAGSGKHVASDVSFSLNYVGILEGNYSVVSPVTLFC